MRYSGIFNLHLPFYSFPSRMRWYLISKKIQYTISVFLILFTLNTYGQPSIPFPVSKASDPGVMNSRAVFDADSYIFYQPAHFYAFRFGFFYGLQNEKHLLGLSIQEWRD